MRATAILVRWKGGWRWRAAVLPPLRIETSQGHAGDSSEVIRKADAELDTYANGQSQVTLGVAPGSLDGLIEGDEVHADGAWQEIAAFTATLDDSTGRWTDIPQFGTVLDEPEQRISRTLRSIGGLNQGTSHLARPTATIPPPNIRPG